MKRQARHRLSENRLAVLMLAAVVLTGCGAQSAQRMREILDPLGVFSPETPAETADAADTGTRGRRARGVWVPAARVPRMQVPRARTSKARSKADSLMPGGRATRRFGDPVDANANPDANSAPGQQEARTPARRVRVTPRPNFRMKPLRIPGF